jgi:cellulose synthase/poly-beta-1,6-N-acetylglucosamine synthase-like glycosyltransferase
MFLVSCLYLALTLLLLPFFLHLLVVTAAACAKGRVGRELLAPSYRTRFVFVIPAHDEEEQIADTVRSCRAVDYDPKLVSVVVIADNCTDQTGRVAREAGAVVFERVDPARRGKGYALEHFLGHIHKPRNCHDADAIVIVDADTVVDADILSAFSRSLSTGAEWVQGYYSVRNPDSSWRTRMLTYAFSLINGVYPLGMDQLGLGAKLQGNGMCFTTRALERLPWRAYGLTEDLEFSWQLRIAGERVAFEPAARVYAQMLAQGGPAAVAQRRRWEVGRSSLRWQFLGPLLRSTRLSFYRKLMYFTDLFFPPLVPLVLALTAAASVHVGRLWDAGLQPLSTLLLPIHALMAAILLGYVLSPIPVLGLPSRYLFSLLVLPRYILWKGFAALHRRPTDWVRTARETAEIHERI